VDRTFLFAKRKGSFLETTRKAASAVVAWRRQLASGAFPVLLQAHKSPRSSVVARMTGLPVITYRESSRVPFIGKKDVALVDRVMPFHEAARIGMLLEPLGMHREEIIAMKPVLPKLQAASSSLSSSLSSSFSARRVIAIAPGSVWGTKRWLPERFARLAVELLAKLPDAEIILTGSQDEVPLCEAIERKVSDRSRVKNLAGKTALKDLPSLFSTFDLVITNDSSPVHYASGLDLPTVAVFGATIPEFGFGPLATKSTVVQAGRLPCRPCSDHGPQSCPEGHFRCMKDVSVEQVLKACLDLL
jgi:heptosyltransferase-2